MKCSQKNCEEDAVLSYVWPGRPDRSYACRLHFLSVTGIADAMGFFLGDVQPVKEPEAKQEARDV